MSCVAYRAGKLLGDVAIDDISETLKQPETFVWLDLRQTDAKVLGRIQQEFGLHELAIEDALAARQRPKIDAYGDSLFVVVKTVRLADGDVRRGEMHAFVGERYIITVRHDLSGDKDAIRQRAEENRDMLARGPGFALYLILDVVVDNYLEIINQYQTQFEAIESRLFKSEFDPRAMEQVYHLRRNLLSMHNAVIPLDDICGQLIHLHVKIIPKELRAYIRDIQDHARQVLTLTDDMREMLTNAMHVNLALVSVKQNEVVKKLAGWGAILAIPTVIFSLYGMNFAVMPELKIPWGYPAVLLVTVIGCVGLYRKLKRAQWL
ncbi:magnesium/cobalt transporter CorA [Martelella alba]|nr:magnesium/cobalt transporter CorA [Martelella alba]